MIANETAIQQRQKNKVVNIYTYSYGECCTVY